MAAALPSQVQTAPRRDRWAGPRMRGGRGAGSERTGRGGAREWGLRAWGARARSLSRRFLPRAVFCLAPFSASRPLPQGRRWRPLRGHQPPARLQRSAVPSLLPSFTASHCISHCLTLWFGHSRPQDQGVCGRLCGRAGVKSCESAGADGEVLKLTSNAAW